MIISRESAAYVAVLLNAHAEGKTLQMQDLDGRWLDIEEDADVTFTSAVERYRVKPATPCWYLVVDGNDKAYHACLVLTEAEACLATASEYIPGLHIVHVAQLETLA